MRHPLAFVSLAMLCGCELLVSLDGYSGGDGGKAPDASSSSSGASGASDASSDTGATSSSGFPVDATPLRRTGSVADGTLTFTVDARVSFGFAQERSWQLLAWHDLSTADGAAVDLGNHSATSMSEPIQVGYAGGVYGTRRSEDAAVEIVEETAARSTIRTTFVHRPPNGSVHTATTTYVIHADGRIVESVDYRVTSGAVPAIDYFEFAHTNVSPDVPWDIAVLAGGAGFELVRKTGSAGIVAATHETERHISNDDPATNRFWSHDGGYNGQFDASWEYRFYGASDRAQREAWVGAVGVALAAPAYDRITGAWKIDAKDGTTVSFDLPAGPTWDGPAFELVNWGAATLHATAGGAPVKVIAARSGASVLVLLAGSVAPSARTIVFSP